MRHRHPAINGAGPRPCEGGPAVASGSNLDEAVDPHWQSTTFPTPRHERVHGLLRRLVSEGAAHFFADACAIVQRRPPFRTTTHLVGHLIREVESATRQVLRTLPKATAHARAIATAKKRRAGHVVEIDAVLHALGLDSHKVAAEWRTFVGEDGWHGAAHRDDLRSPRAPNTEFETRLAQFVEVLLLVLDAAEGSYAELVVALEVVAGAATPSRQDLDQVAVHLAPGVTALAHVFEKLSADWLVPLRERHVFSEPPETRHHDGGALSFPRWPQADYLYRVAAEQPDEVAATIESVPTVGNEEIHRRFLEAAARMPAATAARVAMHEAGWLATPNRWVSELVPDAVGKLASVLIDGGEIGAALSLLRATLALAPAENERRWEGPRARFDSGDYDQLAHEAIPALAAKAPEAARDLLNELIERAGATEAWAWRRRIDRGVSGGMDEPIDTLLVHLRDLYLARAAIGPGELRAAVAELEASGVRSQARLALHVLRVHGKAALDLVVDRAADPERLGDGDDDADVTLMIRDRFPDLTAEDRGRVVRAMRENASVERLRAEFNDPSLEGKLPTIARHRLLKWLHILGDGRSAGESAEYAALVAELGKPVPRQRGPVWGPNPPRRESDLLAMADAELLAFLREWVPASTDPFEPSRAGLGREIQKCATKQPERFARLAREFRSLAPDYVGHLCRGINETTKQRTEDPEKPIVLPPIDWGSVLDLLEWTAAQSTSSDAEDSPRAWTWPRRTAVDLAEDAVAASAAVRHTLAARGWVVVRDLMSDPDPSAERDAERGDDADGFAINTVRGQAIHAAIRVAETLHDASDSGPPGLALDVLREIERRADPAVEPSAALRSILAMRFDAIFNIDRELARRVASALFPSTAAEFVVRQQAWRSFVEWNEAPGPALELVEAPYAIAVAKVADVDERHAAKLGEHLVWLGARAQIDFDQPDNLLRTFVERAPVAARRHALDSLGRAIYHSEEALDGEVGDRLQRLWGWWASVSAERGDAADLVAFGWWFTSGRLDQAWSLGALEHALLATGGLIHWDHEVVAKLGMFATFDPRAVAQCLRKLIDSPDRWQVIRSTNEIRTTLSALLDTDLAPAAREIASRLVARGWPVFQDLARP